MDCCHNWCHFSVRLLGLTPKPNHTIKSLCDDCVGSGQCALAKALSKNSVPLRGGMPVATQSSFVTSDLENWQPFRPMSPFRPVRPDTPDIPDTQTIPVIKNIESNPYADNKLKHKTCPFHRLKSLGFDN